MRDVQLAVRWTSSASLRFQIDPPFLLYITGSDPEGGSAVRPVNDLGSLGDFSAESAWMGRDANSTQIQPIGIPACLDRHVGVRPFMRMTLASPVEKSKRIVV